MIIFASVTIEVHSPLKIDHWTCHFPIPAILFLALMAGQTPHANIISICNHIVFQKDIY